MEDKLREQFKQNGLEQFEEDLLSGHEDRFETRLLQDRQEKQTRGKQIRLMWLLAAAACFIAVVVTVVFNDVSESEKLPLAVQENQNTYRLAAYSDEAGQQEKYYESKLASTSVASVKDDPDLQKLLELLKSLEEEHTRLQARLDENYHNEHLINAVLDNYRLRLEVLERIQRIVSIKNRIKNQNHENEIS